MKIVTKQELKSWESENKKYGLIDVREEWEHEAYNIGGSNIPLGELMSRKEELNKDRTLVFYCEKGIRSAIAIQRLQAHIRDEMYNLEGGMSKWRATE